MNEQDSDIVEIEQYLNGLSPKAREAKKHEFRAIMARADEETRERERQRKRDILAKREEACQQLIDAVMALRPLLVEIDRTSDAVRRVVPDINPTSLDFSLTREVANLNLQGALDQTDAARTAVYAEIAKGAK